MAIVRAKVLEFDGGLDDEGRLLGAEGAAPIVAGEGWNPESLVLAAVTRCSLSSLRYYARRAGSEVRGSGRAHGTVTAREEDGVYAFVDIRVEMDLTMDPAPSPEVLAKLLSRAESGCFVGQSLRAKPAYRWRVNGEEVTPA
jgi:organic hydroperoxide reductase OsmC/OhrA